MKVNGSGGSSLSTSASSDATEIYLAAFRRVTSSICGLPSPVQLCEELSKNVCPSGEIARVSISKLYPDNYIRPIAFFGFSSEVDVNKIERPLHEDTPHTRAYREKELIYLTKEEFSNLFPTLEIIDERNTWDTLVVVPTSGPLIISFVLQEKLGPRSIAVFYFKIVGALLSSYFYDSGVLRDSITETDHSSDRRTKLIGMKLTERQERILASMKLGMTNRDIAIEIGYSESLVRQETVIIYAKLGVRGRADLIKFNDAKKEVSGL